jgi:hypothetical protein
MEMKEKEQLWEREVRRIKYDLVLQLNYITDRNTLTEDYAKLGRLYEDLKKAERILLTFAENPIG